MAKRRMLPNRHRSLTVVCVTAAWLVGAVTTPASAQPKSDTIEAKDWPVQRICREIARVAGVHNLPVATFTRLIWTESRFDIFARSRAGAEGIAQFMPGTARERGLKDPFDPAQALPASA
ncbi:MAG: transglycosylase SLT domain-containing protein, partial [Pseudomonadota bacterium]